MQQPVVLLGLPGSGKSFWGAQIAQHYNVPFYDLDVLITSAVGVSIGKIFEFGGEPLFRKIESNILWTLFQHKANEKFILALGGGTPAFNNNMAAFLGQSRSIFLNIHVATLAARLLADKQSHRPLVIKSNMAELIKSLADVLKERKPFYERADYMIYENELSIANFEKIIEDPN